MSNLIKLFDMTEQQILASALNVLKAKDNELSETSELVPTGSNEYSKIDSVLLASKLFIDKQKGSFYLYAMRPETHKGVLEKTIELFLSDYFHEQEMKRQEVVVQRDLLWHEMDGARKRYDDYPKIKNERNIAIWVSIGLLILATLSLILKSKCD